MSILGISLFGGKHVRSEYDHHCFECLIKTVVLLKRVFG